MAFERETGWNGGMPLRPLSVEVRSAFRRLWSELEPIGRAETGGYRRYAWTRTDLELRDWFAAQTFRT